MSSLAATQADGYYLPPEYYESGAYKKQSKNAWYHNNNNKNNPNSQPSSSWRQAAAASLSSSSSCNTTADGRKNNHNSVVVRFELPYDGLCLGCDTYLGRGTRYNATKIKTDESYFTTRILEFHMKCRMCANQIFVIRTDPAQRGFVYVSGIQRQKRNDNDGDATNIIGGGCTSTRSTTMEEFDCSGGGGDEGNRKNGRKSVAYGDPNDMFNDEPSVLERLEMMQQGKHRVMTEYERLQALRKRSDGLHMEDADLNASIRSTFRVNRRKRQKEIRDGTSLGWRSGMSLFDRTDHHVVKYSDVDMLQSKTTVFGQDSRIVEKKRFQSVRQSSIFSSSSTKKKKLMKSTHTSDRKLKKKEHDHNHRDTRHVGTNSSDGPSEEVIEQDPIHSSTLSSEGANTSVGASSDDTPLRRLRRRRRNSDIPTVDLTTTTTTTSHDHDAIENVGDASTSSTTSEPNPTQGQHLSAPPGLSESDARSIRSSTVHNMNPEKKRRIVVSVNPGTGKFVAAAVASETATTMTTTVAPPSMPINSNSVEDNNHGNATIRTQVSSPSLKDNPKQISINTQSTTSIASGTGKDCPKAAGATSSAASPSSTFAALLQSYDSSSSDSEED